MTVSTYILAGLATGFSVRLLIAIQRTRRHFKQFSSMDLAASQVWLECLRTTRHPGACLIFDDMDGFQRFVQFRREVEAGGETLTCDFPVAPWSASYVEPLKSVLDKAGIPYSEEQVKDGGAVEGFVVIPDLDSATAAKVMQLAFCDVFGHSAVNVRVRGHGFSGS